MKRISSLFQNKIIAIHPTIILLMFLCLFTNSAGNIFAQEFNLSLYPPLLRINIRPGKSITQVFKISNNSPENKTLVARIVPFTSSDQIGNPILNPNLKTKWLDYFSLANSEIKIGEPFEVKANSSEQLILSLSIPDTAPLKDIYAALLISSYSNELNSNLQGSDIKASIASNMLITVSSQLSPATVLKVIEFAPKSGSYLRIGNVYITDNITPLTFEAIAKNDGDFTAETKGIFKIQKGDKEPVHLQSILPQYVLGKGERKLINGDDKDFNYTPSVGVIGFYQARIEIHTDNANTTSQIDIVFLPIKIFFGFLVGLSLLLIIVNIAFKPEEISK